MLTNISIEEENKGIHLVEERILEELNTIIGNNLKTLRIRKNLSLGQLAELSGISKALLGQIEKGKNNPTINTIWKIANGLKVPYTVLLENPNNDALIVSYEDALKNAQMTKDKKCSIFYYYPYTSTRNYEFSGMIVKPGCSYTSVGNLDDSQEYIFVQKGILTLVIGEQKYTLNPGDSMHFMSNQVHEYRNETTEDAHAIIYNDYI